MNNGSVESLKWSTRCGLRPKSFQIFPIVVFDSPVRCGHLRPGPVGRVGRRRLQGRHDHVLDLVDADRAGTARAFLIEQPVQAVFDEPAAPLADRVRRAPHRSATVLLSAPSAHANTILDRSASACAEVARGPHRVSCSRSSAVRISSALGRPVRGIPQSKTYPMHFPCTTWRSSRPIASRSLVVASVSSRSRAT